MDPVLAKDFPEMAAVLPPQGQPPAQISVDDTLNAVAKAVKAYIIKTIDEMKRTNLQDAKLTVEEVESRMNVRVTDLVDDLEKKIGGARMTEGGKGGGHGGGRYHKRDTPKPFALGGLVGREARWATWSFGFAGYYADIEDTGEDFLKWIESEDQEITEEDLRGNGGDSVEMSKRLYKELRQMCTDGEPFLILRNLADGQRGAEVWRRLHERYRGGGSVRAEVIEEDLKKIRWTKDEDKVPALFDQIDALRREYDEIMKDRPYPTRTLKSNVMAILPKRIRDEVRIREKDFPNYESVRDYVLRMNRYDREDHQKGVNKDKGDEGDLRKQVKQMEKVMAAMEDPMFEDDVWMKTWQAGGEGWPEEEYEGQGEEEECED